MCITSSYLVSYPSCITIPLCIYLFFFFFFNDTPTTEIYTLSLHDALPILRTGGKEPRHFSIDPSGNYLLAENQLSDKIDRKSTRLNSSHANISYAVFCLKKKKKKKKKNHTII